MLSVALRGVNIVANYSDQDMLLVKIQYCILHWQVQLESIGELLGETLAVAAPAPAPAPPLLQAPVAVEGSQHSHARRKADGGSSFPWLFWRCGIFGQNTAVALDAGRVWWRTDARAAAPGSSGGGRISSTT
jgi:hypothetical protein